MFCQAPTASTSSQPSGIGSWCRFFALTHPSLNFCFSLSSYLQSDSAKLYQSTWREPQTGRILQTPRHPSGSEHRQLVRDVAAASTWQK